MISALKNISFWFCMAMTAVIASSCIYDDEGEAYQVGEPAMLARFVISVGNDQGGSTIRTKQTTEVTQAQSTPVFRGMQDIAMIPFNISGTKVTASDARLSLNLTLPATGSIPQVTADNTINSLNATSNSQVYQDVSIALGTNAFLCYGKATGDDNAANGSLDCAGLENGDAADITFTPKAIYTGDNTPAEATAIAEYLTSIAKTSGWSELTNGNFKKLRDRFLSQHAGSSTNVLATLQKLYDAIVTETGTLRDAIIGNMKIGDTANDVLHLTAGTTLAWNDNVTFKDYPTSIDLPDGAAYIAWSAGVNNKFITVIDGNFDNVDNRPSQGTNPEIFGTGVALNHYATPAPLYYRANTKINVDDDTHLDNTTVTTSNWTTILAQYEEQQGEVTPATRSVALINPLEYAVARLDAALLVDPSTVDAGVSTLLDKDNVGTNAADLELTGVLVGGQYAVDFEFTPITASGTEKPYIIYDNTINPADATTTPVTPITLASNIGKTSNYIVNHTLVLPSKADDNINIYFELRNNSDHDITTQTGLVPPGCKLYLPITAILESTDHYVFQQDKATTLNVTISNLKNACNVVPSMDVGLPFTVYVAVNTWQTISAENHPLYNW